MVEPFFNCLMFKRSLFFKLPFISCKKNAVALLLFSLGCLTTIATAIADRQILIQKEEELAITTLSSVRSSLEQNLYQRLSIVTALEAFVKSLTNIELLDPLSREQVFQQEFDQFTQSLDNQVSGILSMQLAPDGIVTYLTHRDRNQQAIGHDLLKDDTRREQALKTIADRTLMVAGPLNLIQGGEAIIARQAIFTEPGAYNRDRYIQEHQVTPNTPWLDPIPDDFWGFATVLIDTQTLYASAGLNQLPDRYRYAIRGRHGLGAEGEVFWGDPEVFDHPLTTMTINFANGSWLIGIELTDKLGYGRSAIIVLIGVGISGILSYGAIAQAKAREATSLRNRAIATNKAKTEFMATISHELRTPLNAIVGMTEGLKNQVFGPTNSKQLQALDTIENSSSHLLSLINDILDLAKIDTDEIELDLKPTPVEPLCRSTLALIKQKAYRKTLHLDLHISPHLPPLWGDERRIRQALINLLHNAIKFTPEGGWVTLEALPDRNPNFVQLRVKDTGIGIADKDRQKLFQPFVQIDSALNRQYSGTGLGLALVKKIVDLHGGKVRVTSTLGEGSCFTLKLPCLTPTDAPSSEASNALEGEQEPISGLKIAPLILLVDENEAQINTLSSYLKAKGYRILLAKTQESALELAQSEHPQVILMDLQMSAINGLEILHLIRQDLHLMDLPIIALTALSVNNESDLLLQAGVNEYLSKPVKLKQLVGCIQNLLSVSPSSVL